MGEVEENLGNLGREKAAKTHISGIPNCGQFRIMRSVHAVAFLGLL
jgi:hypothetical protein